MHPQWGWLQGVGLSGQKRGHKLLIFTEALLAQMTNFYFIGF